MLDELKEIELSLKKGIGPYPNFSIEHVIMTLLLIGDRGFMGRKSLSKNLFIGEGVVRTMLDKLRRASLLEMSKIGCRLTSKGFELYKWLKDRMDIWIELHGSMPWSYRYSFGMKLRGIPMLSKKGLEERDVAIRAGAEAAMVLRFEKGELYMPDISNLSKERPDFASMLIELFKPSDGDVILITGAEDKGVALHSLISVAYFLLKNLKQRST